MTRISKTCQICGNSFTVKPYRAETAKTCSAKCRNIWNGRSGALKIGDARRYTGSKSHYIKRNHRHEHRGVMEKKLGRSLLSSEIVHHKDENKWNNHPDNLEVITQSQHIKIHIQAMLAARKIKAGF